jgi:E3 ubiquitin-protein ligase SHPRH
MSTLWCHVVDGTIEQSVLNLATRRRMTLVGQVEDGEEQKVIDQKLLAVGAEELREGLSTMVEKWPGGGEMVKKEDLWDCLFSDGAGVLSNKKATNGVVSGVDRELRGHAAEMMAVKGEGIVIPHLYSTLEISTHPTIELAENPILGHIG